jgi:two-component system, chemotaxis family, CheB/CheR fusion protein
MQEFDNQCLTSADAFIPDATSRQAWSLQSGADYLNPTPASDAPTILVVDADAAVRDTMRNLLEDYGYAVECFTGGSAFLDSHRVVRRCCLVIDALMPTVNGLEVLRRLKLNGLEVPTVMMSFRPALPVVVLAMNAGASQFIEKPITRKALLDAIGSALGQADNRSMTSERCKVAAQRIASLTSRQHQILKLVLGGHPSKNIATDLSISQRTVENHRAEITRKTHSKSLSGLIQTALCAGCSGHAKG